MMNLLKQKPFRSKKYTDWVKTLPCCVCGSSGSEAHHIIGVGGMGGMGTKAPDSMTMPMCRKHHTKLHNTPEMWQDQFEWVLRTLDKAIKESVIVLDEKT